MSNYRDRLEKVIDKKKISDDPNKLKLFIDEQNFESGKLPDFIIYPTTEDEIIRILEFANKDKIPIIVSSSKEKYYGGTIPKKGGIIIDLSKMNNIIEINYEDRYVWVQPGVSFEQLLPELKKKGLRISLPIGQSLSTSIVSCYADRCPLLTGPKMVLSEGWQCILNMHLILANGIPLDTGTANWCKNRPNFLPSGPHGGPDLSRLFSGSQGTLGIITNMIIKAKYLPKNKKILISQYDTLSQCLKSVKNILWYDKAREILIISKKNLSLVLSDTLTTDKINSLKNKCPNWLMVISIEYDDNEKYDIDLADFRDFGINFETSIQISNYNLNDLFLEEFESPDKLNAFRKYKKTLHIPFYINKNNIIDLNQGVDKIAQKYGYSVEDLIGYIMPIEQGHTFYMDYTIHYDKNEIDNKDLENIKQFFVEISSYILNNGGVIDRPYGIWADLIFSKNPDLFNFLKLVKQQLDPNNILNPGRMGL
ncbi:MAG: FAD-binding oxidoreductase [Candidatus Helarchaeota archaeon]